MTVSPNRKVRSRLGQKAAGQKVLSRLLKMESLERRELMASDTAHFHNTLAPSDVNGDFQISPLDALVVINQLNSSGVGSLANREAPTNRKGMVDVDGDNTLSPLDALSVINSVNRAEGVGELVEVKYEFYALNTDGTLGAKLADPNPNNTLNEVALGTGDRFVVRTLMTDVRANASGVFSAYHDFSYTNADSSTAEKIQLQWSEYNGLKFTLTPGVNNALGILSGTFKIRYGSEVTNDISIAKRTNGTVNPLATARNIQSAIEALPSIGAGNVVVTVNEIDPSPGHNFDIFFRNSKARTDIPNAVLEDVNLTVSTGTVSQSISSQTNPDPSDPNVARGAFNYIPTIPAPPSNPDDPISPQVTRYDNGPAGSLDTSSLNTGRRTLRFMGGFADTLSYSGTPSYQSVIMDTAFVAGASGVINLQGSVTVLPETGSTGDNLGIALYGATNAYLTGAQVLMQPAQITILDRLTAVTDVFAMNEDALQTPFNVVANDVDRFGTARGVVAVTQPAVGGTVSIGAGTNPQNILFTPASNYNGPVVFTYTIRNNVTPTADQAIGTVTINVAAVNDAPTVIGTSFSVAEDAASPLVILPTQVFSPGPADEANQTLTFTSIVTAPNSGIAVILNDGTLQYTPAPNFFGPVTLTVRGKDNGSPEAFQNATLTINVTPVNDPPNIVNSTFSVAEDPVTPLVIPVNQLFNPGPANESSQTVTVSIVNPPASGTATILPNGSLQYQPVANFFGTVNMVVRGTDNGNPAESTLSTITINVTSVNDAPIAVADTGNVRFAVIGLNTVQSSLDVMRNDSAGPGEDATDTIRLRPFTNSTTALGGSVTLNSDRTRVLYTPPAGNKFTQVDSFLYTIEDSFGVPATATAEVFLVPPQLPYALDDDFVGSEDSPNNPFSIAVLGNDLLNPEATPSLVRIVTQPGTDQGTGSISGSNVVYSAPQDFFGNTSLVYEMTDSNDTEKRSQATVFIRITEVNDAPIAVGQNYNGTEDTPITIAGSTITASLSRGAPNEANQTLTVIDAKLLTPGSGALNFSGGNIGFMPNLDFNGDVLIEYTVRDNGTTNGVADPLSATATLTISIAAVNDAPIAGNDTLPPQGQVTREDSSYTFSISSLLQNDRPGLPDNESNQTVSFVDFDGPVGTSGGGTVTQIGNQLVYSPANDFNGIDTFTYKITDDGSPALTAFGTVTIVVSEVNDAPVADDLSGNAYAGVNTIIDLRQQLAAMFKGAANESGQSLRIVSVTPIAPFTGNLSLNSNGTSVTYFAPLDTDTTVAFDFVVEDNGTTVGAADPLQDTGRYTLRVLPFIPSSIKGRVYIDDNANNVIDSNTRGVQSELPVGGVEVTLSYADPANPANIIRMTEMTEADGTYDFELLPPGTYTVSYVNPVAMIDGSTAPRSFTATIDPPGDKNLVFDFPVLGIVPSYGSSIEYLASSFYIKDSTLRQRGMYAVVNSTGYTEWTSKKEGFDGDLFHEVVLSNDGTRAYLTAVRGENEVYTATLVERRQFLRMPAGTGTGNQLIRILASSSDLVWNKVNINSPSITANGYLKSVDEFFEQENWM